MFTGILTTVRFSQVQDYFFATSEKQRSGTFLLEIYNQAQLESKGHIIWCSVDDSVARHYHLSTLKGSLWHKRIFLRNNVLEAGQSIASLDAIKKLIVIV